MTLMVIEKFLRKYIFVIKYQKIITYPYKPLPNWVRIIQVLKFQSIQFDIVLIENLIEYTIDKGNHKKFLNNNFKYTKRSWLISSFILVHLVIVRPT